MASRALGSKRTPALPAVTPEEQPAKLPGALCHLCPARKGKLVPSEPAQGRVRLTIVAESPGRQELEHGRPLVGASGKMLGRLLEREGIERNECHITNAVPCACSEDDLPAARRACARRLTDEIRELDGSPICAIGKYALASVLGYRGEPPILKYRGSVIEHEGRLVLPTIHPAFVMRSPSWEGPFEHDIRRISRVERGYQRPETGIEIEVPTSLQALEEALARLGPVVSDDIESVIGTEIDQTTILSVGFSDGARAVVVPWRSHGGEPLWNELGPVAEILGRFAATRTLVTQNGPAFDFPRQVWSGMPAPASAEGYEDTMLASRVLASHLPKRLDHIVSMTLDAPPWKQEHKDARQSAAPLEEIYHYNGLDAIYTAKSWPMLSKQLDRAGLRQVYESDKRVALVATQMQLDGIAFDWERAASYREKLNAQQRKLEAEAEALMGYPVKMKTASKSLSRAIFEDLKAPVAFRTDSGEPSTAELALRWYVLSSNERLAKLSQIVIDYRSISKMDDNYLAPLVKGLDGRIHPSWKSSDAITGRWACADPNVQNLPRPENDPTQEWGGIRALYIARPGTQLVSFDVSQQEFRISAYLSGDPNMIAAVESGDVHAGNATAIWGEEFTKLPLKSERRAALRSIAKSCGLAITYGAGAAKIHATIAAKGIPITFSQVEGVLAKLRRAYAVFFRWQEQNLLRVQRLGYVESPILGRRSYVGHAPKPTEVGNFPIQSGAADFLNERLPVLARALPRDKSRIVAQVHDALYLETVDDWIEQAKSLCVEIFQAPLALGERTCVLPLDLHVTQTM